jgi:hypothetical protein
MSIAEQAKGLALHRGPSDPSDIKREQGVRARELFSCICRNGPDGHPLCTPPREPTGDETDGDVIFSNEAYAGSVRQRLRPDDPRPDELPCLAWAAAAVQKHKAAGMTFADALRCAYDDEALAPALDSVASLEVRACR